VSLGYSELFNNSRSILFALFSLMLFSIAFDYRVGWGRQWPFCVDVLPTLFYNVGQFLKKKISLQVLKR